MYLFHHQVAEIGGSFEGQLTSAGFKCSCTDIQVWNSLALLCGAAAATCRFHIELVFKQETAQLLHFAGAADCTICCDVKRGR